MTAPAHDRETLLAFLRARGIAHAVTEHPAIFTVEEGRGVKPDLPGLDSKNLFLKDRKDRLWLVSAAQDTTVDLKTLPRRIGADRLSFGREAQMWETLGVRPGSVTALALINDPRRRVGFVLDRRLWEAPAVNFHPLINTATVTLDQAAFRAFLSAVGHAPVVVDFSTP